MNQQVRFDLLGCAEREFHVGAVHGIACLEGNYSAPSETGELSAQFRRREAQRTEVIVGRALQALDAPAYVPRVRLVHGVVGAGMGFAGAVEHCFGFGCPVGLPDFLNVQHGQHHALGVAQRDFADASRELLGKFFSDIERDRHRPENSTGQPHVMADAFVIGFGHKAVQRRKASAHQQFEIANLTGSEVPGWPLARVGFQFCGFFRCRKQIDKFAAVRSNQVTRRSRQEREPPRFVNFGLNACKFSVSQKESMMTSGLNGEGHANEATNLLRANDPN